MSTCNRLVWHALAKQAPAPKKREKLRTVIVNARSARNAISTRTIFLLQSYVQAKKSITLKTSLASIQAFVANRKVQEAKRVKAEEMDEERKRRPRRLVGSDVHKVGFWGAALSSHFWHVYARGRQATACQADGITKATCSFRRPCSLASFLRKESAGTDLMVQHVDRNTRKQ